MATIESTPAIQQEHADAETVLRLVAEGQRVSDPALRRRIQERADNVRREMLEKHGVTDFAAELTDRDA